MTRPAPARASLRDDWWWIFDPRCSLRARAALGVGVVAVAFTLLLAWIGGLMVERHIEQHTGAQFEGLAFQLGDKIDRAIYARYRELQFVASLPALRGAGSDDDRRQALDALQVAAPDLAWIGFANRQGRILSATQRNFEGTDVATREWFIAAHERPFISAPHEIPTLRSALGAGDETGAPRFLDLAVPVTGLNGQLVGVLAAHLDWRWSRDVLVSVLPENARREKIGGTVYAANRDALLDSGHSGWTEPPPPPAIGEARRFRGSMLEEAGGAPAFFSGYARSRGFKEFRGLGWISVVRQPAALVYQPAHDLRRQIVGWGAGFTALLVGGAWWFAGRLARRLHSVAAAASKIQSGDVLSVIPRPQGNAEIDDLCRAVGELVEEIRPKTPPFDLVAAPLAKPTFSTVDRIKNSV